MNKGLLLLLFFHILITGCSIKNIKVNKGNKELFIKYDNTKHIISHKEKVIKTLTYYSIIDGKKDAQIIFYINKFPYKKEFNLCEDEKKLSFNIIKQHNLLISLNNNKATLCKGYIKVIKKNNIFLGNYKLILLKGFIIKNLNGHKFLQKKINIQSINSLLFKQNSQLLKNSIKYRLTKQFWSIN